MADLQIILGGKGVKIVASPVNAEGQTVSLPAGEQLAWTSSDAVNAPVTQDLTDDPTGLTATSVPLGAATGVVFTLTGTSTDNPPVIISDPAPPVDIVADAKLGGFTFQESAL